MKAYIFVFLFNSRSGFDQTFTVFKVGSCYEQAFNWALDAVRKERSGWWRTPGFNLECHYHEVPMEQVKDAWSKEQIYKSTPAATVASR